MRKLLIVLLSVSILTACNNKQGTKTETKTQEEKKTGDNDDKTKTPDNTAIPPTDVTPSSDDHSSSSGKWSESDQNRFMSSCESTATPKVGAARANEYCNCMLGKLEKSFSTYAEADRELTIDEARMNRMVDECNGKAKDSY
jgi:hypothetical protein